jgi:hypothetical protein
MAALLLSLNYFWHGDVLSPYFAPEFIMTFDSYSREWGEVGLAVCFLIEDSGAASLRDPVSRGIPGDTHHLFNVPTMKRSSLHQPLSGDLPPQTPQRGRDAQPSHRQRRNRVEAGQTNLGSDLRM